MSKTRRKFTRILFFSVSILGVLSALLLLNDPPPAESDGVTSLFAANTSVLASQRDVASVTPISQQQTGLTPSPDALIQIDCTEKPQTLHTGSTRFRIKGPLCSAKSEREKENGKEILSTEVQNTSNGYVATVFQQADQFTTDYINLNEGKNEIIVKFNEKNGIVQKTITVVKNSPPPPKIQD